MRLGIAPTPSRGNQWFDSWLSSWYRRKTCLTIPKAFQLKIVRIPSHHSYSRTRLRHSRQLSHLRRLCCCSDRCRRFFGQLWWRKAWRFFESSSTLTNIIAFQFFLHLNSRKMHVASFPSRAKYSWAAIHDYSCLSIWSCYPQVHFNNFSNPKSSRVQL